MVCLVSNDVEILTLVWHVRFSPVFRCRTLGRKYPQWIGHWTHLSGIQKRVDVNLYLSLFSYRCGCHCRRCRVCCRRRRRRQWPIGICWQNVTKWMLLHIVHCFNCHLRRCRQQFASSILLKTTYRIDKVQIFERISKCVIRNGFLWYITMIMTIGIN